MIFFDVRLDEDTRDSLSRIANALEAANVISLAQHPAFTRITLNLMAQYKETEPDFTARVFLEGPDAEGGLNPDADIPAGFTLTVTSDNADAFSVTQQTADPRFFDAHVGSAFNPDGSTPAQANVVASLFDAAGTMVATGAELVTVTVGDAVAIADIVVKLPAPTV